MYTDMKRTLAVVTLSFCGLAAFAGIHEEYTEGYEILSSEASSRDQERPMSFYKEGKVAFFRGDSAFTATIGNMYDLVDIEPCPELTGLGIYGTFAYDPRKRTIYFSRVDEIGNADMYEATLQGGSFSEPKLMKIEGLDKLRKKVRGSSTVIAGWTYRYDRVTGFFNPTLANNGTRIYFSADFKDHGFGNRDIWYIDKAKNKEEVGADWVMPKNASDTVIPFNTKGREDYPFVVGDSIMYLTSDRPGGFGGLDVYMSRYEKDHEFKVWDTTLKDSVVVKRDIWTPAVNLDSTFNTRANEYNFIGSSKLVMFLSNRTGGKGKDDIYVPMPFRAEPDVDLMPEITLTEPKGFNWVLFFFDFDQSDMKPEYFVQLDELVSAMKEFPGVVFEISGHTDERGSDKYNMKLSQKRADYVRGLLIERGMSPNELVAVGKGFHETVIKNAQTEPEHEQNRRVDIKILNE